MYHYVTNFTLCYNVTNVLPKRSQTAVRHQPFGAARVSHGPSSDNCDNILLLLFIISCVEL